MIIRPTMARGARRRSLLARLRLSFHAQNQATARRLMKKSK
jgi:hypothetical protein